MQMQLTRLTRLFQSLILFLAVAWSTGIFAQVPTGASEAVRSDQVTARLLAHAPEGVPTGEAAADGGATIWLGLQLEHAPQWHTYWKNTGDSGLPTALDWDLPAGVEVGDVQWPIPQKIRIGNLANYGYEDTVLLPVPLIVTPGYQPPLLADSMEIGLRATWLVCKQECIPQDGQFRLNLPLHSSTALYGGEFEAAFAAQPIELPGAQQVALQDGGQRVAVRISGLPETLHGQVLELFPETPEILVAAAVQGQQPDAGTWTQGWDGDTWVADYPVSPYRDDSPDRLPLVVTAGDQGWRIDAPVSGSWPAPEEITPVALAAAPAPVLAQAAVASAGGVAPGLQGVPAALFAWALLGALVGGLILNLMPCVFPILAIKVLGFTQHGSDRRAHRADGLAYTAGVLVSFLALGGLMLLLRAAGHQLGWGFQLQSPTVVALLTALFVVIGLNLSGVFAFSTLVPSRLATHQARQPLLNAGLTGVLAVAVASPCTAPFMGAALGLAIGLPAWQALAIFGAIGLGMALPYLAASWVPAVARALPRPGPWMDTFKKFMAFPMFGTAVWLLWVLGQQIGINGATALLALLVTLALVLWAWSQAGRARWITGVPALAVAAFLVPALAPHVVAHAPEPVATAAQVQPGSRWQPWSAARMDALLAQGQPVFVDFTAAWCVTCQYNKKSTLSKPEVLVALDAANVQTLRADWTRRDPAIGAAIQALGRSGVPVYLLQAPGQPPIILAELLTVDEMMGALARISAQAGGARDSAGAGA